MNHRDDATETARFRFRPMKQLLLIRHAKSDWDHPGLSDHDRPLNDRGRRDCPRMAEALRSRGITPDLIVTSTAVRAATTAEAIAGGLGLDTAAITRRSDVSAGRKRWAIFRRLPSPGSNSMSTTGARWSGGMACCSSASFPAVSKRNRREPPAGRPVRRS